MMQDVRMMMKGRSRSWHGDSFLSSSNCSKCNLSSVFLSSLVLLFLVTILVELLASRTMYC